MLTGWRCLNSAVFPTDADRLEVELNTDLQPGREVNPTTPMFEVMVSQDCVSVVHSLKHNPVFAEDFINYDPPKDKFSVKSDECVLDTNRRHSSTTTAGQTVVSDIPVYHAYNRHGLF